MSTLPVVIVGAGGHAAVVADALLAAGRAVLGFVDSDVSKAGSHLLGLPVLGDDSALLAHGVDAIELVNGVGGTGETSTLGRRAAVQRRLEGAGWRFATVLHPAAVVSVYARLNPGCQVMAGSVVQALATIGAGAIVNTRAVVEHDAWVGAFAHVGPGAVLCGKVRLGTGAHVGAGATVRQGVTLGDEVVVGIGAAVVRTCSAGVLVGVPARPKDRHQ